MKPIKSKKKIKALIVREFKIPERSTGRKMYDNLGIDFQKEVLVFTKPHDPYLNSRYIILPDDQVIEFPSDPCYVSHPQYLFFVISVPFFRENFCLGMATLH